MGAVGRILVLAVVMAAVVVMLAVQVVVFFVFSIKPLNATKALESET